MTARAAELQQLYSFSGLDGANPAAAFCEGDDGNFYGSTHNGGTNNFGTIFRIAPNGSIAKLLDFQGVGVNGGYPMSPLAMGQDGMFYGTTWLGTNNASVAHPVAFQFTSAGLLTVIAQIGGNGLIVGRDGYLYGTSPSEIFRLTTSGAVAEAFIPAPGGWGGNAALQASPFAGLVDDGDGNLYGTSATFGDVSVTNQNGLHGYGFVFKVTSAGTLSVLCSFENTNGANPQSTLVFGDDGNLYGTTTEGGDLSINDGKGCGTVFRVTPSGVLNTLVCFDTTNGSLADTSGFSTDNAGFFAIHVNHPNNSLLLGSDGNFYGTTPAGGDLTLNNGTGWGTVFEMTPAGALTTLLQFNGTNGANPRAALIQGADGLYGTTYSGGASNGGTVFRISKIHPLVATANDSVRAYGRPNACAGVLTGVLNSGNISLDFECSATTSSLPGTYTITPVPNAHGTRALANYDVTINTGTLTITPALLTVTAVDTNCVVNTTIPSFTGSIVGLQNNDNITVSFTTTATSASPIGTYTITPVVDDHGTGALANYSVIIQPGTLAITPATATIITPPVSVTNYAGLTATFSVSAGGTAPLSYQWFKGTSKISTGTANILNLSNVQSGNAGSYKVIVSNSGGSVTSAVVTLTVLPSVPTITSLSPSQTNIVGSTTSFSVAAVGSPTLTYQWNLNGSSITGATSATLKLSKITTSEAGTYTVVVSNGNGTTTSDPVVLTVVPETGTYNGLFYLNSGVANDSSGYFTFAMDGTRKFKGNIIMAAGKYPMSGQFDASGATTVTVTRAGLSSLTVSLQLVPTNDTAQVTGTVTDGVWLAQLLGDKAYYATGTAAPQVGTYTFGLRSSSDGTLAPGEGSYGLVKVKSNGNITLTGSLSDVTGISEASALSKNGDLPLFAPLYKGAGSLLGWITFTNAPNYKLTGNVSWIKTTAFGSYYIGGFTNTVVLVGGVRQ